MESIPFELELPEGKVSGFLNITAGAATTNELPTHFHVMERTPRGNYYRGQLMLNPFKGWWLPDSKFSDYAERLGERAQLWYQ